MSPAINAPELMQAWVGAVKSGSIDNIIDQYADDARLKGTVYDGYVRKDGPEDYSITSYFKHFTAGKNNPDVEILSCQQQPEVGDGYTGYEGVYKFNWTDDEGDAQHTYANYEFTFNAEGKIVKHHSSKWFEQEPEKADAIITMQP